MIAAVRSVIAASTAAGSRLKWSGSMSANTGVAPVSATEFAVAAKVNDGTMTSSPGPMPAASRPRCRPEVPEFTATEARPCDQHVGELLLERGDLGTLCDHAGAQHAIDCLPLVIADDRLRGRDERVSHSLLPLSGLRRPLHISSTSRGTATRRHRARAGDRPCRPSRCAGRVHPPSGRSRARPS